MKLTALRRECLADLRGVDGGGWASPNELGQPIQPFIWLRKSGLVESRVAFDTKYTKYRITAEGYKALLSQGESR